MEPTQDQILQATQAVERRGWEKSNAKAHPYRPKGIPDGLGGYEVCQHCHAHTNPARWPLFFRLGEHAGSVLWTCSTCKNAQAVRRDTAVVLVSHG